MAILKTIFAVTFTFGVVTSASMKKPSRVDRWTSISRSLMIWWKGCRHE